MKNSTSIEIGNTIFALVALAIFTAFVTLSPTSANAAPGDQQATTSETTKSGNTKLKGTLEVIIADYHTTSKKYYFIKTASGKKIELKMLARAKRPLLTGQEVEISGKLAGDSLVVEKVNQIKLLRAEPPPVSGERKMGVFIINFRDSVNSCSKSGLDSMIYSGATSIRSYYEEMSVNQLTLKQDIDADGQPDIFGPFTLNYYRKGTCNYSAWTNSANAAIAAAGIDINRYQHRVYILPPNISCGWAGLGHVGCGTSCSVWIKGNYCGSADVLTHEIAHNLTLDHASVDANNDGKLESEYGDTSCVMGYGGLGLRHFNAPHKSQLGWIDSDKVQTVSTSGTYTLVPEEVSSGAGNQLIKVLKPSNNTYYYVSYRAPAGDFSTGLASSYRYRAQVHKVSGKRSILIKSLATGESFSDATDGLTITHTAQTGSESTVTIAYACRPKAPTISFSPSTFATNARDSLTVTINVKNNDTNCDGSTLYRLSYTRPSGFAINLPSTDLTLAAGEAGTTTMSISYGSSKNGTFSIPFYATDKDGDSTVHPTGKGAFSYTYDTAAPARPSKVKGQLYYYNGGLALYLYWTRDKYYKSLQKHLIYRDDQVIAELTNTYTTYYMDSPVTQGATHTYKVVAVDKAGNRAPSSVVTVRVPIL